MGEIADNILNGFLCQFCGAYIEGEAPGYPRYCSETCKKQHGIDDAPKQKKTKRGNP